MFAAPAPHRGDRRLYAGVEVRSRWGTWSRLHFSVPWNVPRAWYPDGAGSSMLWWLVTSKFKGRQLVKREQLSVLRKLAVPSKQALVCFVTVICGAYHPASVSACGAAYERAIDDFCLTKFRLDMQALEQYHWCSWEDTVELYGQLTNCTYVVALKMDCFWPNRLVDTFFIQVHQLYFQDCSLSGRLLQDPPNRILGPFILVPVLVTLLMTALVVWRSKRSEGIV
ncbi:hypothetical protein AAFF_G00007690 [Aldrovandia affinis]|uniref:Receptor activity-modifying protein 1 n=1 Tax=Aldrovandia affinis TaxID=143900 RepID=A0AAD7T7N7_9TELE|nr:hypothetical protein AAFF_G00007690 [Aldrovandia affinis]